MKKDKLQKVKVLKKDIIESESCKGKREVKVKARSSHRKAIEQIHEYDNHQEDEDQEEHVAEPSRWIIVV